MYREINSSSYGGRKYGYGWSECVGFISEDFVKKYEQFCEDNKNNKIKDNSVIYPSPISNYPAYKLKNYIQENKLNIKKARKWDKIDTIIIDKDILNNLEYTKDKKYILIPGKEIISNPKKYDLDKDNYAFRRGNGFHDVKFFYTEYSNIRYDSFKHFKDYKQIDGFPVTRYHGNKIICDNLEFILELFENVKKYNLHVVLDSSIDKEVNKDTVIDIDIYENLYNMLNSSDIGNNKLAREIIANCEYDQSRPYILFLTSCFEKLLTKSDNKNYHAVHKRLNKEIKYFDIWNYKVNGHFEVIKNILLKCPEYKPIFCQCMKVHLNNLYGTELVKEVLSF